MRSWGWDPHDGISVLKRSYTKQLPLFLYHMWTKQAGHLQNRKRAFIRSWIGWCLDVGFPSSRTVRNSCCLSHTAYIVCRYGSLGWLTQCPYKESQLLTDPLSPYHPLNCSWLFFTWVAVKESMNSWLLKA